MTAPPGLRNIVGAICLIALVGFAFWSRPSVQFSRPIEQDEAVTLRRTSVGWEPIPIPELEQVPARGNLALLAKGLGRTLSVPFDANNHTLNSWAVSVAAFVGGFSPRVFRAPAFLAFLASLPILFWLLRRLSRSTPFAVLATFAFVLHPHFFQYSVSCRGYTFSALLMLATLALLDAPGALRRGRLLPILGILGLIEIATFLNVVSMGVTWLLPLALVFLAAPPPGWAGHPDLEDAPNPATRLRSAWLLVQALAGVACAIFVAAKLSDFLDNQSRYGLTVASAFQWRLAFQSLSAELFANPGFLVLAALALLGSVTLTVGQREGRFWGLLSLACVLCTLLYALVSHRFPFPRTLGFMVPLFLVSLGAAMGAATALPQSRLIRRLVLGALAIACAVVLPDFMARRDRIPPTMLGLAAELHALNVESRLDADGPTLIVTPWVEDVGSYLPTQPGLYQIEPGESGELRLVYLTETRDGKPTLRVAYWDRTREEWHGWRLPGEPTPDVLARKGPFAALAQVHDAQPAGSATEAPGNDALLLWQGRVPQPGFEAVAFARELRTRLPTGHRTLKAAIWPTPGHGMAVLLLPDPDWPAATRLEIARGIEAHSGPGDLWWLTPRRAPR